MFYKEKHFFIIQNELGEDHQFCYGNYIGEISLHT